MAVTVTTTVLPLLVLVELATVASTLPSDGHQPPSDLSRAVITAMGPHLVTEGSTLQITCSVVCPAWSSDPSRTFLLKPRIQWEGPRDFVDLEHYPKSQNEVASGQFQSSLLVPEVSTRMQGLYSCTLAYTFLVNGKIYNGSASGAPILVNVERKPLDKFTWTLLALVGVLSFTVLCCLFFIFCDRVRSLRCRRRSESKDSLSSKKTQRSDTRSVARPSPLLSFVQTVELPTVPMNSLQPPSDVHLPDRPYPVKRPQRLVKVI
ncbi:hypothetical protein RvY_11463-2 [Ramazzottius varieornatus]|uniref:Ig-like domain-containing protein n=1 Tax=Ramazzottius varieornatus TaxID=947166 RepID=A0A1D1VG88_RAMVA|nr:hypothetical protein RvY_11463-2 [Ramazzottius varieornatus]